MELLFEAVTEDAMIASASEEFEAVTEQSERRLVAEEAETTRSEVVPQGVDAVLLSDELVALPSSLSDAESAAATVTFAAAAATEADPVEAVAGVVAAAEETKGVMVAAVGRWPSLRLRISGVLSDIVLIFNFPSSSTEGEVEKEATEDGVRDRGCCADIFSLSEMSNSSPELTLLEIKKRTLTINEIDNC